MTLLTSFISLSIQLSSQDVWNLVPPFPTTCYWKEDGYIDTLNSVLAFINYEVNKQNEINLELTSSITDSLSSLYVIQYVSGDSNTAATLIQNQFDDMDKGNRLLQQIFDLDTELSTLHAAYSETIEALDTLLEEMRTLDNAKQPGSPGYARYEQLNKDYNDKYEKICQEYFLDDKAIFLLWLKRYKQTQMEYASFFAQSDELLQKEIYNLKTYKSTAHLAAVSDYLESCMSIFSWRKYTPYK